MKIKAKVYYQDFSMNVQGHYNDSLLVFKPETAVFIHEFEVDVDTFGENLNDMGGIRNDIAGYCYEQLNINEPLKASLQSVCRKIRHTSMSIGDYVEFEDGEVWLCKSCGWKIIKP
jgi:hypothetical protein